MTLFGVDVTSVYQPNFSFAQAAADGYDFAFVKASEGIGGVPAGFAGYFSRADEKMKVVGAYHFLRGDSSGVEQAHQFLSVIRRNGGAQGRLLAVDFEDYGAISPGNAQLYGFVSTVKRETDGHPVICYTTHNFWNGGNPTGDPASYGIDAMWEARVWTVNERRPTPKVFYENDWLPWYRKQANRLMYASAPTLFRQFTWGGAVGSLYVDTDSFEGSLNDLYAFAK